LLKRDEFRGEPLNLNRVIGDTLDLVRNDLIARHITISTNLHDATLPILADSVQLQQLFLNLIFNAAEAMGESATRGGVLLIATDILEGVSAHVMLSDTGPGLKTEILGKLFEPFVSTKIHGLGLGLSISRAIAASHNGLIWAQNNSGRGATFHVTIPLADKSGG
jgi:signal transduction histidine kinase